MKKKTIYKGFPYRICCYVRRRDVSRYIM